MKSVFITIGLILVTAMTSQGQTKTKNIKNKIVDVSCAQCQFKLKEPRGCDLAIRMNGQIYFVDGTNLDAHGDAHDEDGFCNAIRRVNVSGTINGNRILVSRFELKPIVKKKD